MVEEGRYLTRADGNGNPSDDSQANVRNPTFAYTSPGEKTVRVSVSLMVWSITLLTGNR